MHMLVHTRADAVHLLTGWADVTRALQVHMLVRGARMRASGAMQDRVLKHPKIEVHFNTAVDDAYPDGKGAMAGIHVKDTDSGEALDTRLQLCGIQGSFIASPTVEHEPLPTMLLTECCAKVLFRTAGRAAGEGRQLPIKGLFYGIGHQPNSTIVKGQIELDEKGYVVVSSQLLALTPTTTDSTCRLPELTDCLVDASSLLQPAVTGSAAQPHVA